MPRMQGEHISAEGVAMKEKKKEKFCSHGLGTEQKGTGTSHGALTNPRLRIHSSTRPTRGFGAKGGEEEEKTDAELAAAVLRGGGSKISSTGRAMPGPTSSPKKKRDRPPSGDAIGE